MPRDEIAIVDAGCCDIADYADSQFSYGTVSQNSDRERKDMANNTERLFDLVREVMTKSIEMIGLDVLTTDQKDIDEKLYGSPLIQRILDAEFFNQGAREFYRNSLVKRYLASVKGGEKIRDKSPLLNVFREVLPRIRRAKSIEGGIRQVFDELVEILKSQRFTMKCFTILQNFKADEDQIVLPGTGLTIKNYTRTQLLFLEELIERSTGLWAGYNPSTNFYVAEIEYNHLIEERFPEEPERLFRTLNWGLKLLDPKPVGISSFYYIPWGYAWHPFYLCHVTRKSDIKNIFYVDNEYFLENSKAKELAELVQQILVDLEQLPGDARKRLEIAFARYIDSDSSDSPILDIVIAFEILLLPGVADELGFRLSQRAALLLGASREERIEVFNNMRRIYSSRSKLVHGEMDKKGQKEMVQLKPIARDYLRRTFLKLLKVRQQDLGNYFDYLPFG